MATKMRHTGFQMAQDGPKMRGTGRHRWPKMAPRCEALGAKMVQEGPKMRHTGPQLPKMEPR